jgi:hypothetical protein
MSWHPPWSLGDRYRWATAHPWLAGFYAGLWMAFFVGVAVTLGQNLAEGVVAGGATLVFAGPLFALGTKRRWGLRAGTEHGPYPTLTRPWVQASDRALKWFMWSAVLGATSLLVGLVTRADMLPTWGRFVSLGSAVLMFWTTRAERRRRKGETGKRVT